MSSISTKRRLVVQLTSVHSPKDVRIFYKECRTLARHGYEVRLVAPAEQESEVDGVRTIPIRRPERRIHRFTKTQLEMFCLAAQQRGDVYHFHDPELALVGLALKLSGYKVIYDIHEGYSEAIVDRQWIPGPVRGIIATAAGLAERVVSKAFDAIIPATPHIAENFPKENSFTVRNFAMQDELVVARGQPFALRPPHFAFVGEISQGRGVLTAVDALGLVTNDQIKFHLGGKYGEPGIEATLKASPGWKRVVERGFMKRPDIADLYGRVLAGVVVFQPTRNYVQALPTKFFEYLSAGIPAIASNFPVLQEIVDKHKCGITIDPRNPAEIARAMDWMAANPEKAAEMGARGRQAVLSEYNWENEAKQLLACYDVVLS